MEQLESRSLLAITTIFGGGVLSFMGDGADDKLVLRATATPSTVEYDDGQALGFISQAGVTSISFNGGTGDDQLVVFNSNGLVNGLLIGAPITFDGEGGDEDTLSIGGGGPGIAATYTPSSPDSGNISYVKGPTTESITFDGTESLFDEKVADSLSVNAGGANDIINVVNGPISPVTIVDQGGPVIVDGGDRDDHGTGNGVTNTDGWKFIQQSIDFLDDSACLVGSPCNGTAFTKSVLIIGAKPGEALDAAISAVTAEGLTFDVARTGGVGGTVNLSTVNFANYKILYVPSSEDNLQGDGSGINDTDILTLTARKNEIRTFVRRGGGLYALTEAEVPSTPGSGAQPFGWLELPQPFTFDEFGIGGLGGPGTLPTQPHYLYAAPALGAAGFTITNTELNNGTPWHIAFTGPAGFNGLSPFVYSNGPNGDIEDGGGDDRIVTLGRGFTSVSFGGVQTNTVNFAGAFLPINFDSKTTVNVDGQGGDDTILVEVTTPAVGLMNLNVNGGADNDLIDIKAVPAIVATTADGGAGNDTVTRHATGADDTINIVRGATTTVEITGLNTLSVNAATTEALLILAGLGDDQINVSGSGGPGNLVIDGGSPTASDTLNVATGANASVTFGTDPASGVIGDPTNGDVAFHGIEHINLTGAGGGTLTVNGTNGDDAINQAGTSVTVNNGAVVNYGGSYAGLTLNGHNGDDAVNVNPSTSGVTALSISGGGPTASDSVVVNGTTGSDAVNYAPTGPDSATITGLGPVISITTAEHVIYNGQGGLGNDDALTVTSPGGTDIIEYTPGGVNTYDTGSITMVSGSGVSRLPIDFLGLGFPGGSLTFASTGGGRPDALFVNGTAEDDVFILTSGDDLAIQADVGGLILVSVPVSMPAVSFATLRGHDGDDTFNLSGDLLLNVLIEGGNPDSGSDVLNFTGSGAGAVTVDLTAKTITEAGFGAVSFSGVEAVNIDANAALTVNGTAGDDTINVQPTALGSGNFTASSSGALVATHPQFTYTDVGTFTVNGGSGGFDHLRILGNDGQDVVTSAAGTVTRAGGTVTLGTGLDRLTIATFGGSDLITLAGISIPTVVEAGDQNDTVNGSPMTTGITVLGGAGFDVITGGSAGDVLQGDDGDDDLTGGPGGDRLFGGAGWTGCAAMRAKTSWKAETTPT